MTDPIGTTPLSDACLVQLAIEARKRAYAPYSKFCVGAALLCGDGSVVCGCNIENASFGATICAERTAFVSAIAQGKSGFSRIAIVGGDDYCYPCGVCRQFISEHAPNITILAGRPNGEFSKHTLSELFPHSFSLNE